MLLIYYIFKVKRVEASNLSFSEFVYTYALTSTPVVFTGLVEKMTSVPWSLQHIQNVAGKFSTSRAL